MNLDISVLQYFHISVVHLLTQNSNYLLEDLRKLSQLKDNAIQNNLGKDVSDQREKISLTNRKNTKK